MQVILFIPEQPENTSLNVNPESFQSLIHQRSEIGTGFGQGGDAPRFRAAHTHTQHSVSLKIHGLRGTLRALSIRSQSEELLLRKVSVNVHICLVDVANYGTGGCPVWTEQYRYSLFPVGKTNT